VSKSATVSKLEALLARIRTRAIEPRLPLAPPSSTPAITAPVATAPPVAVPAPPPVAVAAVVSRPASSSASATPAREVAPSVAPAPVVAASSAREATSPPPAVEVSTMPPPSVVVEESTLPPPRAPAVSEAEFAIEVDMSEAEPIAAAASPAEQVYAGGPADSQERLAITDSLPPEASQLVADAADVGPAIEQVEVLGDDESLAAGEDDEIEESPVSSRRAVVSAAPEERLAQLAFGSDEPPQRHTPPPKSGPLPAPPGMEFEADITGVHKTEGISGGDEAAQMSAPADAPSVLTPEAARPTLASSVNVVDVIGQAQSFAPSTFIALLDASLSL
jgi:hypothetical protein